MKKITALIIEDNYKSQELLLYLLKVYCPLIKIVGVASTINESILIIQEVNPQLVLADVHLENEIIFDLFEKVKCSKFEIIFITAHNEYAIKAFKYQAIDLSLIHI